MRLLAPASYPHVDLLLRRMTLLDIDPDELRAADPLLFCELQGRCSLCLSTERCATELAFFAAKGWRDYCPNKAVLVTLSKEGVASLGAVA